MSDPKVQGSSSAAASQARGVSMLHAWWARLRGVRVWTQTLRDATLPAPCEAVVRQVCASVRLWPGETNDVARELCAHFRDGLEAGRSEHELVSAFGDPRAAAKLIRRAARRKRPLAWRAWVWAWRGVAALVVLGVAFYGYAAVRIYTGSPTIARNLSEEYNQQVRAREQDRAWPIYRAAIIASPDLPWGNGDWPANWPDVRPGEKDYDRAVEYWSRCGGFLAEIRRGAALPISGVLLSNAMDHEVSKALARRIGHTNTSPADVPDPNPDMIGVLLPHLGQFRDFSRLLVFDTRMAVREGDGGRVVANIDAMLGIAHQAGQEPFLISELVGYAILSSASKEVLRTLQEAPHLLRDEDLSHLAHRLAGCISPGRLMPSHEAEQWMFDDALQRMYTDDGHGDGRMTAEGMKLLGSYVGMAAPRNTGLPRADSRLYALAGPLVAQGIAGRREMREEYRRLMASAQAWAGLAPWVRIKTPPTWIDTYSFMSEAAPWSNRYALIAVVMPALNAAYWSGDSVHLEREAAMTMLACEAYRRKAGAWPASLDVLTPRLLPRAPRDIFDGEALRYVVKDGAPVLYSIGHDLADDGGVAPADGAFVGGLPPSDARSKGDWIFFPRPVETPRSESAAPVTGGS